MATQVMKDCGLWIAGYNLRGNMNALALDYGAEMLDATVYGNDTRIMVGGLKTVGFSHQGLFDPDVDKVLFDRIGVSNELMTIAPAAAAVGDPVYFKQIVAGEYSPGGQIGELMKFSLSGDAGDGPLVRGVIMANGTFTATANGAIINHGAVGATQKLYAGLHITAVSGGSPSVTVKIQSAPSGAFSTPTDRFTFSAANAIGAQWAAPVSGAITDAYWRAVYTITGTTPSFTLISSIGIQ